MMKKIFASLISVLVLSSCASTEKTVAVEGPSCPPPARREVRFDATQYMPYDGSGTARINGRVCVKTMAGKTKCLANQTVVLNPVTDYSTEWFERHWKGGTPLEAPHAEALKYNRTIKTDAQGYFSFTHLRPGSYYVGAEVCPPCATKDNKAPGYKYQRLGGKATMKKSIKVDLKPVYTP